MQKAIFMLDSRTLAPQFGRRLALDGLAFFLLAVATIALLPGTTLAAQSLQTPPLQPFHAEYDVVWKGITAGTSTLDLAPDPGNGWRYVSRNVAHGLFKLALPGEILQTSVFSLDAGQPRPKRYAADDGTTDTSRDVELIFDWASGRVRGTSEGKSVDLPSRTALQDPMSVQIALMQALAAGERPQRFFLADKDEIKEFVYDAEPATRLHTALGDLDTLVYASHRPGSDRVTRLWLAPSLGYTPVQAERRRGSKLEWSMRIRTLRR